MRSDTIFFFFQAEDGIRYLYVTGVQTCALPIYHRVACGHGAYAEHRVDHRTRARHPQHVLARLTRPGRLPGGDRKSTRLNSSHVEISYAVFCLKKKKTKLTSRCCISKQLFLSTP